MQVTVRFLGSAYVAAGRKSVCLDVPRNCTGADIAAALAKAVPNLVGRVVAEDRHSLLWPNVLDVGGTHIIADFGKPLDLPPGTDLAIGQEPC